MKKKYIVIFIVLIILGFGFYLKKDETNNLEIVVFESGNGFGYSISFDEKIVIKQDEIPAIQGNLVFCNYKEAEKIARLVRSKLYNKENPKITLLDLSNLDIQINCTK